MAKCKECGTEQDILYEDICIPCRSLLAQEEGLEEEFEENQEKHVRTIPVTDELFKKWAEVIPYNRDIYLKRKAREKRSKGNLRF